MKLLESIFNSIDEALLILSPTGDILFFNEEAEHIHQKLGATLKISLNVFETFPSDVADRIKLAFEEVKVTKALHRTMSERRTIDGSMFFAEINYIPTLESGSITHINVLIRDVSENKIFERKITDMASELRNLIDKANAVIIGLDTQGYITDWNIHTKSLTGYSKNEAFTQKFTQLLLVESDHQAFEKILQKVLAGSPVVNVEVNVLSKNGKKLIFLLSASSRYNSAGKVTGVIFVGQDITIRRRVEQELQFAHERLVFHIENAPLGFIEWHGDLKLKSWTQRAEEIFGWTQDEFINNNLNGNDLVYEADLPWVIKTGEDFVNGKMERNHIQHRNVRKDGAVIWCEWFNSVLKNHDGKVITIMSLVQDITERKNNELRLKEAQMLAHLGNWEVNLKTQKVRWSEETFRILGYPLEGFEPSLQAYFDLVHSEDIHKVKSIINSKADTLTPQAFYHKINRKGIERTLFIVSRCEVDAINKPVRLYGTMMDVSELTEKERELQAAVTELEGYKRTLEIKVEERTKELMQALKKEKDVVEMKSRFVSIASHEFRTPLSSIEHTTNFIRKNKRWADDPQLKEKLKDIEKQSKHMMFLLDDILNYGKSEAGKIQLVVTRINLKEFFEKIVEDVEHTTKGTHTILLKLDNPAIEIDSDEKLLRNVLINLLTNAIKYSPGKDKVTLAVDSRKHLIEFKVIDSGMGIAPEEQDLVFEAFVRGRSVENIQGTGLGLSIVKKAVELLQGKIELESEINKGTTVVVTIPKLASEK